MSETTPYGDPAGQPLAARHAAPSGEHELARLAEDCAAVSREHAAAGRTRVAVLAMWACDLHVLQLVLIENGLDQAPDPLGQLAAVGEAVEQSLGAVPVDASTPRSLMESTRAALVATFDPSVHPLLTARFAPLDHLDGAAALGPRSDLLPVEPRLGGRTPEQLVAELEATAHDCAAVAQELLAVGDVAEAHRQLHHADLASYEAFLVCGALAAGDETLASVELAWDLAARSHAAVAGRGGYETPGDVASLAAAVAARRERLAVSVGLAHATSLRASFVPVPVA